METTNKGLWALRQLQQEMQDDAGLVFPQAMHDEILVLYDMCQCLDLNIFQYKEVLGEVGWAYNGYLERRVEATELER